MNHSEFPGNTGSASGSTLRLAAACLLLALLAACSRTVAPPPAPAAALQEGKPVPPALLAFLASGHAGGALPAGKLLIVNVWASWCGPCQREMPDLQRLSDQLDAERFAVIGMSTDDDALLASEFLARAGVRFANVLDQGGAMARQQGLRVYPDTFVIAPDGTLLRRLTGWQQWDSADMASLLEQLSHVQADGQRRSLGI